MQRRPPPSAPRCDERRPPQASGVASRDISNLGINLQGIDNAEIIDTVHARRAPTISINASLQP